MSSRRIGLIMNKNALVSSYTVKKTKVNKDETNLQNIDNILNQ